MSATEVDIPGVKIEYDPDGGPDQQIVLEQDWSGNVDRVSITPLHIRLMAERLGILPVSDLEAQRTIQRLCRQLRSLHKRIKTLDEWLFVDSQKGHEDLSLSVTFSEATLAIIEEYLRELPDATPAPAPTVSPQPVQRDLLEGQQ